MRICVYGLWHLGAVTSACLASLGHDVVGLDDQFDVVAALAEGRAPVFEPELDHYLKRGLEEKKLRFSISPAVAADVDVVWVAFDTPVDDEDRADTEFVIERIKWLLPQLTPGCLVLVSSQLPVGSIARLERHALEHFPGKTLLFAYSPENLRLGKAVSVFMQPDRVVVGCRSGEARARLIELIGTITDRIEWMSVEAAEMTKHALNAFLAVSVTFANEIAAVCEKVGVDAKEVERGLKSEQRIGPRAYLAPGGAFSGGTLARDITFLNQAALHGALNTPLLQSVLASNEAHKTWPRRKLMENLADLNGVAIAIWGLTYKPGTDTLRRSQWVELCNWLLDAGAELHVHDPKVRDFPEHWSGRVMRHDDPLHATKDATALVVGTEWPEYRAAAEQLSQYAKRELIIIDANRHLAGSLQKSRFYYLAVGTSQEVAR